MDDEEESSSDSVVDKIKKQLPFLSKLIPSKKKVSNPDATDPGIEIDEDEDDDDDDKKSKKKNPKKNISKIIYIVVGLGLVVIFAEDFLPKEEVAPAPVITKRPRPVPVAEKTAPVETPTETPTEEVAPVVEAPAEEVVVETPAPVAVETTPVETVVEDSPPAVTPVSPDAVEPVISESPTISPPDITTNNQVVISDDEDTDLGLSSDNAGEDNIGAPGASTMQGGDLTDKILLDLEKQAEEKDKNAPKQRDYVSPPDYEYTGRGLVYNCVGKHWACVDAPSYKTCEQNYEGNKALNKKAECYPFNVYDKPKTCSSSQLMMTSSNAKTGFCND